MDFKMLLSSVKRQSTKPSLNSLSKPQEQTAQPAKKSSKDSYTPTFVAEDAVSGGFVGAIPIFGMLANTFRGAASGDEIAHILGFRDSDRGEFSNVHPIVAGTSLAMAAIGFGSVMLPLYLGDGSALGWAGSIVGGAAFGAIVKGYCGPIGTIRT